MKYIIILLLLFWLFTGCGSQTHKKERGKVESEKAVPDFTGRIEAEVKSIHAAANKKKTSTYGGGDISGVKIYLYNPDSTLLKVINEYGSGEYGFTKEKFYIKNGILLLSERLTSEINFERADTADFDISYEKNYFQTPEAGLKLSRQKVAKFKYDTLFNNIELIKTSISPEDYIKELNLVKEIETYQLLDEE